MEENENAVELREVMPDRATVKTLKGLGKAVIVEQESIAELEGRIEPGMEAHCFREVESSCGKFYCDACESGHCGCASSGKRMFCQICGVNAHEGCLDECKKIPCKVTSRCDDAQR